jgi:transaldolase
MKFFIDTANITEIKSGLDLGLVDGVTTNPSLISREKKPFMELIKEILKLVPGPVSVEVNSPDVEGMIKEARKYAKLAKNAVIKVPTTPDGLKVIKRLTAEGIKTNATLIFSPTQALLVAKAGATYASPFIGRLDDIAQRGMDLIDQVMTIYENYGFETEVIVASIRSPMHVVEAALTGAHIATIPYTTMIQLIKHPLTDIGIEKFNKDWEGYSKLIK